MENGCSSWHLIEHNLGPLNISLNKRGGDISVEMNELIFESGRTWGQPQHICVSMETVVYYVI